MRRIFVDPEIVVKEIALVIFGSGVIRTLENMNICVKSILNEILKRICSFFRYINIRISVEMHV